MVLRRHARHNLHLLYSNAFHIRRIIFPPHVQQNTARALICPSSFTSHAFMNNIKEFQHDLIIKAITRLLKAHVPILRPDKLSRIIEKLYI